MINENFLQSAVKIRREYLKLSSNMSLYKKSAEDVISKLEKTYKKIDEVKEKSSSKEPEVAFRELLSIVEEIENEGKRLQELIDPINDEIEKLGKEEQELYRKIKETHSDIDEDVIISTVKQRLIKENLI
jgi:predicted  nucleic acid-binding Zn-ribbon protein